MRRARRASRAPSWSRPWPACRSIWRAATSRWSVSPTTAAARRCRSPAWSRHCSGNRAMLPGFALGMPSLRPTLWAVLLLRAACGETSSLPPGADIGPNPTLPEPNETLIPTVDIADAIGWPDGGKPVAAEGLAVTALATGLDHPRWLHVLPNGDVLV